MKKRPLLLFISWTISIASMAQPSLLTPEQAIQLAIQNNFNVTLEKNAQEIGKINNNWGTAGALPTLNATGATSIASNNLEQKLANGTVITRDGAILRNVNAGLQLSWRIFDGFRMFATKKRLEELETIGETNFRRQINATVFDVISAYYNIVQLKQQQKAVQETIRFFEERQSIAESRFKIGTAPKTDLLQAQVDLNTQKALLMQVENALGIAKSNLNHLLGREPGVAYEVSDVIAPDASVNYDRFRQKARDDNFDLMLARSNLAVLLQEKREIIAQRLPTITVNGNYNFAQSRNDAGFNLFNRNAGPNGNIGIAIPLFNGGNNIRQQKIADINIANQQVTMKQVENQVQTNLLNAYLRYQNALNMAALEKTTLQLIQENNSIATERFKKLAITSLELRQVQIDFINSQTRYINTLFMAKIAETEMKLLAGELGTL